MEDATRDLPDGVGAGRRPATAPSRGVGVFNPGDVLAGRYRIVSRLGKGGMGEVYRADDLTLGCPVALKFLAPGLSEDAWYVARFREEVKLARQISHANVCRVYDIGEADGRVFLSMEYVEGEDLAGLLRRIGRLPEEKAVELSRQLCAGLAAAHERGVIHRDLKPANVMIDGQGRARVMDFGVAGVAAELAARGDIASGTPAYMAPEQFAGREVTRRSDIYSLGLVIYELFTGKPALQGGTLDDLRRLHENKTRVQTPSSLVRDLDPAVERVILRCLEPDPADRPASALAVAAALPGGDPLAAALAAGETPSPELVAMAGEKTAVSVRTAGVLLAASLIALILVQWVRGGFSLLALSAEPKTTAQLVEQSRKVIAALTGEPAKADRWWGLSPRTTLLARLGERGMEKDRWRELRGHPLSALSFWYREQDEFGSFPWYRLGPTFDDPPLAGHGSVRLQLDAAGRLLTFARVINVKPTTLAEGTDWSTVFALAGLEWSRFAPTAPQRVPVVPADTRLAWSGTMAGLEDTPLVVEAATELGWIVSFRVIGPWTDATTPMSRWNTVSVMVGRTVELLVVVVGAVLGIRSLWTGRGDQSGALRVGMVMFLIQFLSGLLASPTLGSFVEGLLGPPLVRATFLAGSWWFMYNALEPYVRRVWPHALVTWARLLEGRVGDALVGRDVLIGFAAGVGMVFAGVVAHEATTAWTGRAPAPVPDGLPALLGPLPALGAVIASIANGLHQAMFVTMGLIVLRVVLRSRVASTIGLAVLVAGMTRWGFGVPVSIILGITMAVLLTRVGLVAAAVMLMTTIAVSQAPPMHDFSAPYVASGLLMLLAVAAGPVWAYRSIAARR